MRSKGEAAAAPVSERGHYVRQPPLLRSARRSAMPPVSPTAGPSTPQPEQVDAYKSIRQVIAGPSVCPNAARQLPNFRRLGRFSHGEKCAQCETIAPTSEPTLRHWKHVSSSSRKAAAGTE